MIKKLIYLVCIIALFVSCQKEKTDIIEKKVTIDSTAKGLSNTGSAGFNITGGNWFNDTIITITITIPDTTKKLI